MSIALTTLVASFSNDGGHGWWPVWPLLWLLVIGAVIWFVARRRGPSDRPQDGNDRAKGILAERFARGEISGEEYRERLDQLR
jgi:putative membrane protein